MSTPASAPCRSSPTDQRPQEALLRRGRASEQPRGEPGPLGRRAGARDSLERRERRVHVVQRQRGRVGGRRHGAEPAIADARPPLARLADQVRQPDRRLGCVELRQAVGEPVALGETRGGGCDVPGRRDEVGEQQSLAGELGHGRPVGRDVDLEALAERAHARPAQVVRDAVDPERGVDRDRARRPVRVPCRSRRAGTARRRRRPRPAASTQRDTRPGTRFAGGRSRRSPRAGASRSARPR